jgi:hypothetical protein
MMELNVFWTVIASIVKAIIKATTTDVRNIKEVVGP